MRYSKRCGHASCGLPEVWVMLLDLREVGCGAHQWGMRDTTWAGSSLTQEPCWGHQREVEYLEGVWGFAHALGEGISRDPTAPRDAAVAVCA